MRIVIKSLDDKEIHVCRVCDNLGEWKGKDGGYECSRCGTRYTREEWASLEVVKVPSWTETHEENRVKGVV